MFGAEPAGEVKKNIRICPGRGKFLLLFTENQGAGRTEFWRSTEWVLGNFHMLPAGVIPGNKNVLI